MITKESLQTEEDAATSACICRNSERKEARRVNSFHKFWLGVQWHF